MTKSSMNPRKTAGRLVLDTFKDAKAFGVKSAQPVEICKDLPLSTKTIAYTISNMMTDGILIQTEDKRFYYSEANWQKFQKKFNRIYWILLIIPVSVAIFLYALKLLNLIR